MSAKPSATASASPMGAGPILGILLTVVITIILITTFTLFTLQRLREKRAQQAKQTDPETSLVAAPPYCSHRFGSSETVVDEKRAGDFGYGGGGGKGLDEERVIDRVLPVLTRPSAAFQPSKYDSDFSAEKAKRPAYLNAFINASQADLHATDPFADHTNTLRNKDSNDQLRVSTAQTLRISAADTTVTSRSPSPYDGRHSEDQVPTYYSGSVADSDIDVPPMLPPLTLRTESSWNPFEHETYTMSSHY